MKKTTSIIAITALLAGSLILSSCSNNDNIKGLAKSEQLINTISKGKIKIIKHFDTESDLYGFVVVSKNQEGIIYTTKDGKYLIPGPILNKSGNVNQQYFEKYVETPMAIKAYSQVKNTNYIQQGNESAPHKMYVVVDPNCIACHEAFKIMQTPIAKGKLAVRWVLVGMIKPTSPAKAMAILASKNPLKALKANEATFNDEQEEGGMTPLDHPTDKEKGLLSKNMTFIKNSKIMSTPVLIYNSTSNVKTMQAGLPPAKVLDTIYAKTSDSWL